MCSLNILLTIIDLLFSCIYKCILPIFETMPELAELKIMADFVNAKSKGRTYNAAYDVAKGNIPSK